MTTRRRYYAMSWTNGVASNADTGRRIADYVAFASRGARDAWVQAGASYRSEHDYREPVTASDPELRAALARDAREGMRRAVWRIG